MRKSTILLITLSAVLFSNCKKTYTCECFNPGGVFKTYKIKGTEKKAADKCEEYSQEYQTVPMSETACVIR